MGENQEEKTYMEAKWEIWYNYILNVIIKLIITWGSPFVSDLSSLPTLLLIVKTNFATNTDKHLFSDIDSQRSTLFIWLERQI